VFSFRAGFQTMPRAKNSFPVLESSARRMSESTQRKRSTEVLRIALVAISYFVVAKLGLQLAFLHPSASPIWPATGVAIAALLLWGYRVAPAIFIGAFVANQLTAGSLFTSLGIAAGNTLEAVAASYLVQRFRGGKQVYDDAAGVARFAFIAVLTTIISAAFGTTSLAAGGYIEPNAVPYVGLTWWLGDLAGALVVTPVVLLWARNPAWDFKLRSHTGRSLVLPYLGAAIVGFVAFTPSIPALPLRDLLGFLTILPLLWAALRLTPRHTATLALILSGFAVWGTLQNGGPFASPNLNDSFLLLIMFILSAAVPALALSAELSAKRREEEQQRQRALETEVLWQASVEVARGGSFEELLQGCLERICRLTGWPAGHVVLPDDAHNPTTLLPSSVWYFADNALRPVAEETRQFQFGLGEGLPGRIWEEGGPVWIPNVSEEQNLPRKEVLLKYDLHAGFGFPVYSEGRLQAVLEFFSTATQPPDEQLLHIVQSIGQQLGRVLERQRADEQQKMLLKELNHRVGNTLAVIQSMFRRSAQHARSMQDLEGAFSGRLMNLSTVYKHLSESEWQTASVPDLVRAAVEPYCAPDYKDCDFEGPDLRISASMALSLIMILHELATNAAKHGAFAQRAGNVRVTWNEAGPERKELQLTWQEFGVATNIRAGGTGYGFALIDATTKSLGARVERRLLGEGILVDLAIPLR
jgi:two-component sensor histidine kinase/integral membrane sensor domain MASE1